MKVIEPPEHGGTYTGSITGKPRQFDFRCRVIGQRSSRSQCALLAIECKNLHPTSPLVICGRQRTRQESYYAFVESLYDEKRGLTSASTKRASTEVFYREGEFVGKSLVRLKEKNEKGKTVWTSDTNSDIWDRWSQALASSVELAESACWFANAHLKSFCSLVLPIVVVPDNLLWIVSYDDTGSIREDPATVDQCEFFVERKFTIPGAPFVLTHIHFVTLRGLSELLSKFWKHHSVWDWVFPVNNQPLA